MGHLSIGISSQADAGADRRWINRQGKEWCLGNRIEGRVRLGVTVTLVPIVRFDVTRERRQQSQGSRKNQQRASFTERVPHPRCVGSIKLQF
jgi:hypothetical protein